MTPPTPAEIRAAREAAGMTQEELAHTLGVAARTISRWECGDFVPSPRGLSGLAVIRWVTEQRAGRED